MRTAEAGSLALLLASMVGCSGDSESESESAWPQLVDACSQNCALREFFDANLIENRCEDGLAFRRGVFIGSGPVPEQAPLSTNSACIEECVRTRLALVPDHYGCWQEAAEVVACDANIVWVCNQGWVSPVSCSETNPSVCDPAGRPSGPEVSNEELLQASRRYCAFLESMAGTCETGTIQQHGVVLGRGEEPPTEPPVSSDELCLQIMLSQPLGRFTCREQQLMDWDCESSSPWVCIDGEWSDALDECDFESDPSWCAE
jgi:hypothetical protein